MNRWKKSFLIAIMVPSAGIVWANSGGPIDGVTGAPAENTCAQSSCHNSFPLNSGNGGVSILVPSEYSGGDTLDVAVSLSDPGQQRWGFELTVLNSLNQAVGTLLVTEATRTQKSVGAGGRQYMKHTFTGTDFGVTDTAPGWNMRWVAPATGVGSVTFYAAGNAANGNGASTGDFIYTTTATVGESPLAVEDDPARPSAFYLGQNFPNPFNPSTTIQFQLTEPSAGPVELSVFNLLGGHVRTLVQRSFMPAGMHVAKWDALDDRGQAVASGVYFYRLQTRAGTESREMTLLR